MRRLIGIGLLLLLAAPVSAQAPNLTATVKKAVEAEQRALMAMQATDAYKLWKAASETRQDLEKLLKADEAKAKPENGSK